MENENGRSKDHVLVDPTLSLKDTVEKENGTISGETAEEKLRLLRKQAKQLAAIAKHLSVLKTLNERK